MLKRKYCEEGPLEREGVALRHRRLLGEHPPVNLLKVARL